MASTVPTCALCGRPVGAGMGYVVKIDVFADPEMPATTAAELASTDFGAAMAQAIDEAQHLSADELQDGVHRQFAYRLCGVCHPGYLANPLGAPRDVPVGRN